MNEPLRIAFAAPRATFLKPGASGDRVFVRTFLEALRARGHRVEVVSELDARDLWRGGVSIRRFLREGIAVRRRMRRFEPDGWLVYSSSVTYPDLFGWWMRPRRYVLLVAYPGHPDRMPRPWRRLFMFAFRRSLARADVVTVYREAGVEHMRALGVPESRIHVLPLSAQPFDDLPSQDEARRHLGLPAGVPIVMCMGRFPEQETRGSKTDMVLDLLKVHAGLPAEVLLVVTGGGDGPGRARVEAAIEGLSIAERVRLAGEIDPDQAYWYYAACDVYAYPHHLDRPWVSVMEAQAAGRAVVMLRTPSADRILDPGRTGLLASDLEEFAQQLAGLIGDRERCERMGRAARAWSAEHFSMESYVHRIEHFLR
jgi:glycosyltransferase involved in cell wall biosynthesis